MIWNHQVNDGTTQHHPWVGVCFRVECEGFIISFSVPYGARFPSLSPMPEGKDSVEVTVSSIRNPTFTSRTPPPSGSPCDRRGKSEMWQRSLYQTTPWPAPSPVYKYDKGDYSHALAG